MLTQEATMTASVVTFSTQMGTGGARIARAVAEKLHFSFYDWDVISQAATEAGVSPEVLAVATAERLPGFLERMMTRLAGLGAGEDVSSDPQAQRPNLLASEDYRQFLEHVVSELAGRGEAVIVNHSGQVVLADAPGVLKVLITGGHERRAARMAQAQNIELDNALGTIEQSDKQRTDYFKHVYHVDWLSMSNYDLALNTDHVASDLAIDMASAAARGMQ